MLVVSNWIQHKFTHVILLGVNGRFHFESSIFFSNGVFCTWLHKCGFVYQEVLGGVLVIFKEKGLRKSSASSSLLGCIARKASMPCAHVGHLALWQLRAGIWFAAGSWNMDFLHCSWPVFPGAHFIQCLDGPQAAWIICSFLEWPPCILSAVQFIYSLQVPCAREEAVCVTRRREIHFMGIFLSLGHNFREFLRGHALTGG